VLGEDGDGPERPDHGGVVAAALRSCAEKMTAMRASRAVEVGASGRGGARE
jgi:hypothetical protein